MLRTRWNQLIVRTIEVGNEAQQEVNLDIPTFGLVSVSLGELRTLAPVAVALAGVGWRDTLRVVNPASNTTCTPEAGKFAVAALPIGIYTLTGETVGGGCQWNLSVQVGGPQCVPVRLEPCP